MGEKSDEDDLPRWYKGTFVFRPERSATPRNLDEVLDDLAAGLLEVGTTAYEKAVLELYAAMRAAAQEGDDMAAVETIDFMISIGAGLGAGAAGGALA